MRAPHPVSRASGSTISGTRGPSWQVQAETPVKHLQELGGWATMDMVMRYAHLAPDTWHSTRGGARSGPLPSGQGHEKWHTRRSPKNGARNSP